MNNNLGANQDNLKILAESMNKLNNNLESLALGLSRNYI